MSPFAASQLDRFARRVRLGATLATVFVMALLVASDRHVAAQPARPVQQMPAPSTAPSSTAEPRLTAGQPRVLDPADANGDGQVTAIDALCLLRAVAGMPATAACPQPLPRPDANGDGQQTATDALCVLRFIAGMPATTACPLNPAGPSPSPSPSPSPLPAGTRRWSDPATWGGSVPVAGASPTIPAGTTVLLDVSPPGLGVLTVNGVLVFDDRDLALTADAIIVRGRFEAGTEARPYRHRATITLTGSDPARDVAGVGTKVIGVTGGTLDLHGEPRLGWTRLAQTAAAGASQLVLERAVDWRAGDRLVIASTDYDPRQAEEVVVRSASGATVTLERPLAYTHWGAAETLGGVSIDHRAEVGLLTRNIVVQGDSGSDWSGFGAHVMAISGGTMRIEHAQFTRVGQQGIMGRYPIHFHMLGDAPGQYVKNASISRTFNRCLTVHGTHRLLIQGNVAYDALGHCYFLEDGVETGNVFDGNLGLLTLRPSQAAQLLPSDAQPATFWITNPDNVYRNNVAAGSQSLGFWFALPEHPTGHSQSAANDANVWPRRTPLREFAGNVAHSNDDSGLFVDNGPRPDGTPERAIYEPRQHPAQADSAPVAALFSGLLAYKNRGQAFWINGVLVAVTGARLSDNAIGGIFPGHQTGFRDSVVVGESANKGNPVSNHAKGLDGRSLPRPWDPAFPIRGFEIYDGPLTVERVTFVNFQANSQREASGLSHHAPNRFSFDSRNAVEALHFENAKQVYFTSPNATIDGNLSVVFTDRDGSVTGAAGTRVVNDHPMLRTPECTARPAWNAHLCRNEYGMLTVRSLDPSPQSVTPVTLTRTADGVTATAVGPYGAAAINASVKLALVVNRAYGLQIGGSLPAHLNLIFANRPQGDWLRVSLPYPSRTPTLYDEQGLLVPARATLADLDATDAPGYLVDAAMTLHLKLRVRTPGLDWTSVDICRRADCR
jgi:cell surface hyaluronidase